MDKNLFLRIVSFAKPYRRFLPGYTAFIIPGMIFGVLNFVLILPVLEIIFEQKTLAYVENPEFSLTNAKYFKNVFYNFLYTINDSWGANGTLVIVCVAVMVASFFANLFKYLAQRTLVSMRVHVLKNMRNAIFNKIIGLHVAYFNEKRKGDLMSTLSNDIGEVQNSVVSSFQVIFKEPIMIIGNMVVLFYMSYQLTIFSLIAAPLSAFFIGRLARKLKHDAGIAQKHQADIMSVIEETLSGMRIIKAFNAQKYVRNKFENANENYRKSSKRVANRQEMASPMSEFLGVSIVLAIVYFGGRLVLGGNLHMSASEFIVYIALYYNILVPVKELTRSFTSIQKGMASAKRIFDVLDYPVDILKSNNPVSISEFKDKLEFDNVSFYYSEKNSEVIKNVTLTIQKGKTCALVGHSGAGKSTMADLIPRFYDVTSGELKLDGINIKDYQPKELISMMGIVSQESILFNDTVFNNIAFGWEDATEDNVRRAAEIANAHEFIVKLEDGYNTMIGDRGNRLSGGQRQRLAIARAVLRNPPILIMDEATSALDSESERLVQDALYKLMKNRTSIVIAHRLSTIRNADCIVVLHNGKIIEQGTHEELMGKKATYYNLCSLQNFNKT
ncbi:MAG: ABC transporter ATP-binding protein/permease [Prevotellaceae bacterium]|jgi:subfamily B ATP-binding cassette protein MsbA|nr:ABC transporter ATP-binding protein/permease [Prevotellaceae bacterium]